MRLFLPCLLLAGMALPGAAPSRVIALRVTPDAARGRQPQPVECLVSATASNPVTALAFHPDWRLLATGGDGEILLWDLESARLAARTAADRVGGRIRALAYSRDSAYLAAAGGTPGISGAVCLLDAASGKTVATLEQAKDEFFTVAFSADGRLLAAGGTDGAVRVWTTADRKIAATLKDHSDWISSVAFSPDGKLLAAGSADKSVQVWQVDGFKPVVRIPEPFSEQVHGLSFSPDGTFLAFAVGGPAESAVRMWRTENADAPKEMDARQSQRRARLIKQTRMVDAGAGRPLGVAWGSAPQRGPARPRVWVACDDNTVKVLGANGGVIARLDGHSDWVYSVAASPDGSLIASGSGDGTVRLWSGADAKSVAVLAQLAPHADEWLILTSRGHFTTSSPKALKWNPPPEGAGRLESPEAVRKTLDVKGLGGKTW